MKNGASILRVAGVVAVLLATSASASFNSFGNSALCGHLDCLLWMGLLLALIVPPLFFLPFWGLALLVGHAQRSQRNKLWWAGINATLCYALIIVPILMLPSRNPIWFCVLVGYVVIAACGVRWTPPRLIR